MVARPLNQLRSGDEGVVLHNTGTSRCAGRLAELGLTTGESVRIVRGGSPMLLQIGGSRFCLRADEAAKVAILCGLTSDNDA
ncbi:MAG: ferrous iron transport protein A [Deltaproteobacteria bacterium]|nr:ferrous iron transport protein A [Deltaproteobacteria bacterium]